MPKQLSFSNESREAIEKGVNTVADAVKVTIGPKAKNVVIERKFGSPDVVRAVSYTHLTLPTICSV